MADMRKYFNVTPKVEKPKTNGNPSDTVAPVGGPPVHGASAPAAKTAPKAEPVKLSAVAAGGASKPAAAAKPAARVPAAAKPAAAAVQQFPSTVAAKPKAAGAGAASKTPGSDKRKRDKAEEDEVLIVDEKPAVEMLEVKVDDDDGMGPTPKTGRKAAVVGKRGKSKKRVIDDDDDDDNFKADNGGSDDDDDDNEPMAVDDAPKKSKAGKGKSKDAPTSAGKAKSAGVAVGSGAPPTAKKPRPNLPPSFAKLGATPPKAAAPVVFPGEDKKLAAAGAAGGAVGGPPKKATPKKASGTGKKMTLAEMAATARTRFPIKPESEVRYATLETGGGGGEAGEAAQAAIKARFAGGSRPDNAPPERGSKRTPPTGPEDCLAGMTFVVTGTLPSLDRAEAEEMIKRHGGKVTTSISSRTTFLVVGTSECGPSKVDKAKEAKVRFIDEDDLMTIVAVASGLPRWPPSEADEPLVEAIASGTSGRPGAAVKPVAVAGPLSTPPAGGAFNAFVLKTPQAVAGPSSAPAHAAASAAAARAPRFVAAALPPIDPKAQLWVTRHAPRVSSDLVGNPGLITTLKQWLKQWHGVHLRHEAQGDLKSKKAVAKADGKAKKAALLCGPPGIGKTSAAHIVAKELGFDVIEVNASDTRGKSEAAVGKGIGGKAMNAIKEMVTSQGMGMGNLNQRRVLIMDECDGMSGGDRGGIADLIKTIKTSKMPIICICNDAFNTKVKSLKSHCLELSFTRPSKDQIAKRLLDIAASEGLTASRAAMDILADSCNHDLRSMLNQLQARLSA